MNIICVDRKGNRIDPKKVIWPLETSIRMWETMNPGLKAVPRKETTHGKPQS